MKRQGRWTLAALALMLLAILVPGAAPAAAPAPQPSAARLQGAFRLAGHIKTAVNVQGEHVRQRVTRAWSFTPLCPAGACATVKLTRTRVGGKDTLLLRRQAPAFYVGTGSFYAPLRCAGHNYRKGESVPFTITVRVTAAASTPPVVATRIKATYTNRSRTNLTPCVAIPGHDAATYLGSLVQPAQGTGGVSGQSPGGS